MSNTKKLVLLVIILIIFAIISNFIMKFLTSSEGVSSFVSNSSPSIYK